jgi:hypothetical protein
MGTGFSFTGDDNKNYKLSPLGLEEWGKFVSWVQYAPYREAVEAELPEKVQKTIYEDCKRGKVIEKVRPTDWPEDEECPDDKLIEEEFDIQITSSIVQDMALTVAGQAKLLRLSLEIEHPDTKGKSLTKVVGFSRYKEIQLEILKINGLLPEDTKEKDQEKN